MVGPLAGILVDKIGTMMVSLVGVGLSGTSILLSYMFKNNFWAFFTFYGVLNGAGLGFLFLPANTSCPLFFKVR